MLPWHELAARFPLPVEIWIDDHTLRGEGRAVSLVKGEIVTGLHLIPEHRRVPGQPSSMGASVGVKHKLVRIKSMPRLGLIWPVDAVAIEGPWTYLGQVPMENLVGVLR